MRGGRRRSERKSKGSNRRGRGGGRGGRREKTEDGEGEEQEQQAEAEEQAEAEDQEMTWALLMSLGSSTSRMQNSMYCARSKLQTTSPSSHKPLANRGQKVCGWQGEVCTRCLQRLAHLLDLKHVLHLDLRGELCGWLPSVIVPEWLRTHKERRKATAVVHTLL